MGMRNAMNYAKLLFVAGVMGLVGFPVDAEAAARPDIVIIVCDDMGFSDIGCFGSEIDTPT